MKGDKNLMIHKIPGKPGILELAKLVETILPNWLKILRQEASTCHSASSLHTRKAGCK